MERDTHSENPLKPSCIMCSVGVLLTMLRALYKQSSDTIKMFSCYV